MPAPALSERDLAVLRSFARRIDPSDAGAHNNLGVLYYQKGLIDEAIAEFVARARARPADAGGAGQPRDRLPRERPLRPPRRRAAASGCAARPRTARRAGSWAAPTPRSAATTRRSPEFEALLAWHPGDVPAHCSSSAWPRRRAGNLDAASDWLARACERDPASAVARFYLGEVLYNRGLNEPALDALREAIARNPDYAEAHYLLAFVYGDMGRHEAARDATKRAIALNPTLARAQANLALERLRRGTARRPRRAVRARSARRCVEGGALAHYNLGLAFRQKGYYEEALREYQLALDAGEDRRLDAPGDGRGAPPPPRAAGGARALRRARPRVPRLAQALERAGRLPPPGGAPGRGDRLLRARRRRSTPGTSWPGTTSACIRAGDAGEAAIAAFRQALGGDRPLVHGAAQPRAAASSSGTSSRRRSRSISRRLARAARERRGVERRRPGADGAQALRGCAQRVRPRGGCRPGLRRRRTTT